MLEPSLLHLEPQQIGLGAASCARVAAFVLIEGIATLIQAIHYILTFRLLIVVLLQAIWNRFSLSVVPRQ